MSLEFSVSPKEKNIQTSKFDYNAVS